MGWKWLTGLTYQSLVTILAGAFCISGRLIQLLISFLKYVRFD